jgi:glutathione reductase (NADPH)
MTQQYDLVVIGTGTAGTMTALRTRAVGWKVAIIDYRRFGGTCALRGCDPKKVLVRVASAVDQAGRLKQKGVEGDTHIDWPELMAFKRTFTDPVPGHKESTYAEKGIDAYHGLARFTGPNTLDVDGQVLEGKHILIASGAEAVKLGIPGEEHLLTNEEFLTLDALPERIVIVGGGYIAAEFSHVAARAGSQITILQRGEHMLTEFDPDLVAWLMPAFKKAGVQVHTNTSVESIQKTDEGYLVLASSQGKNVSFEADLVIHAAGRKPDFDSLDLEAANIATENGKLQLNEFLQSTSNPAVYAAGDAAQKGLPLTPVATHDAKVVSANLLQGNHQRPNYRGIPSVAFTIPPIASVGLKVAQAESLKLKYKVKFENTTDWFTARQLAEPVYGYKVLIEEDSGLILGAHLVGPNVDDVVNLFALAIRQGIKASDLKETMFAYPTGASDVGYMV